MLQTSSKTDLPELNYKTPGTIITQGQTITRARATTQAQMA